MEFSQSIPPPISKLSIFCTNNALEDLQRTMKEKNEKAGTKQMQTKKKKIIHLEINTLLKKYACPIRTKKTPNVLAAFRESKPIWRKVYTHRAQGMSAFATKDHKGFVQGKATRF